MLVALSLLSVAVVLLILARLSRGPKSSVVELEGLPLIGIGLKLALMPFSEVYTWVPGLFKKYGSTFQTNVSGMKTLVISDPKEVEILLSSVNYIQKGYEYFILRPWLREGLLLSDGDKWHQRRKLLTPTFHFKILEDSMHRLTANAVRFVDRLLETGGKPYQVDIAVRASTLDIICETALGLNMSIMDNHKRKYVATIIRLTEIAATRYLKFWLHNDFIFGISKIGRSHHKSVKTVHDFSEKVIKERKEEYLKTRTMMDENKNEAKRKYAFLDRLLELDAQNPGLLNPTDIQEEVDTFTFEGHDTTSAAMVFSLFLLANHPEVQNRAAEEQAAIFGDSERLPTKQELTDMSYLEMVIKEVLRLYPPVPVFTRRLNQDLVLSTGEVVPPGYNVFVFAYFVHRHPDHWDDPETFRPERFAPNTTRHPFSYIPFSAGPRNCIGQKFAMMELKTLLSAVLRRCKLEPVTKSVVVRPNLIMKSEEPIYVKILPRK